MRFSVRGLDDAFTYPCTKADVREAFEDVLLEVARFGGIDLDPFFSRREPADEIAGRVILTVSVSFSLAAHDHPTAYFQAYRAR